VEREKKKGYICRKEEEEGGMKEMQPGETTQSTTSSTRLFSRAPGQRSIYTYPHSLSLLFLWHVLDVVRKTSREINRKFFSLLFLSPPLRPFATKHKQQRDSSSSNSRQQQQHIYTLLLLCVCVY
jgi:hypothetical protein